MKEETLKLVKNIHHWIFMENWEQVKAGMELLDKVLKAGLISPTK